MYWRRQHYARAFCSSMKAFLNFGMRNHRAEIIVSLIEAVRVRERSARIKLHSRIILYGDRTA